MKVKAIANAFIGGKQYCNGSEYDIDGLTFEQHKGQFAPLGAIEAPAADKDADKMKVDDKMVGNDEKKADKKAGKDKDEAPAADKE